MISKLMQAIIRKKSPVIFTDLTRIAPVSSVFGLDRGTAIDRYYIERFLQMKSPLVRGRVLEIGDSTYSKRFGEGKVEAFDILHATPNNKFATIIGDLTDQRTLPHEIIDCFICTQTFNFIFDVEKAVAGAHYLLKPGGTILATVAGVSQISRYDMDRWGDYWRFTTASVRRVFEKVFGDDVEVKSYGNVLAACALLQGIAVEDIPYPAQLDDNDPDYQVIITLVARKAQ